MGSINRQATVTIANGQSLSAAFCVGQGVPLSVQMPAAFTGTALTFQGSGDNTTYQNLYDDAGNELSVVVAASRNVKLPASDLAGYPFLKIRSGTAGTPTTEGADRTLLVNNRVESYT
jgi:hypothetical protein